jgi:hypothetical protein
VLFRVTTIGVAENKKTFPPENEKPVFQSRAEEYAAYLRTEHLQRIRLAATARANGECRLCGAMERLEGII